MSSSPGGHAFPPELKDVPSHVGFTETGAEPRPRLPPSPTSALLSARPSDSDCDGEVNPATMWLPSAADLPVMVDGRRWLITIFDPLIPRPPPPRAPRWEAPPLWKSFWAYYLSLGVSPLSLQSIGDDWRPCFCAVASVPSRPLFPRQPTSDEGFILMLLRQYAPPPSCEL